MSRANFIRTMILLAAAVSVSGCYYMPTNGPTSSDVVAGRGFAHGFVVLSETADFFYKCDDFYSPKDELSIRWNDPAIGIEWGVDKATAVGQGCGCAAARRRQQSSQLRTNLMRILLTGTRGQVGSALKPLLEGHGTIIAPPSAKFDLSKPETVTAQLEKPEARSHHQSGCVHGGRSCRGRA